ncbi:MAG TPA: class I SAM-dependent methyltransferase [Acidimicrobiales bacterium]|nr:class I SAM-dependent methyltransferase [Acidimicrobiales bacterium]
MSATTDPWERHATWWRETFTNGADLEYELQILPLAVSHLEGVRRVLDLGSGEGQLARRLAQGAGQPEVVVGLEPSAAQLASAVGQAGGPRYVRGVGERLPFRDGSFDGIVCCLVIEHSADPDALLAEAVRVLAVGGRFLLLVNHPMFQGTGSGFVDDQILGEHYWRVGPYLREDVAFEEVDPGVRLRFAHRPLSRYVNPVTALGCVLTRLEEPEPPLAFLEGSVDLELESAIPRLLLLRFERTSAERMEG